MRFSVTCLINITKVSNNQFLLIHLFVYSLTLLAKYATKNSKNPFVYSNRSISRVVWFPFLSIDLSKKKNKCCCRYRRATRGRKRPLLPFFEDLQKCPDHEKTWRLWLFKKEWDCLKKDMAKLIKLVMFYSVFHITDITQTKLWENLEFFPYLTESHIQKALFSTSSI